MLKKLLIAALLVTSVPAQAGIFEATPSCKKVGKQAAKIMRARQKGVKRKELRVSTKTPAITLAVIKLAYVYPVYNSKAKRKQVVKSFRNKIEFACYNRTIL
jgi:hypothetical protein